jgi:hypothetical protein
MEVRCSARARRQTGMEAHDSGTDMEAHGGGTSMEACGRGGMEALTAAS